MAEAERPARPQEYGVGWPAEWVGCGRVSERRRPTIGSTTERYGLHEACNLHPVNLVLSIVFLMIGRSCVLFCCGRRRLVEPGDARMAAQPRRERGSRHDVNLREQCCPS